jgi:hypothetical protein
MLAIIVCDTMNLLGQAHMKCPGKSHIFPWVKNALLGTAALISIAFIPWTPRNTLRADNSTQPAYTVAQLDSLFHTVYHQDENPYKGSGWKAYRRFSWFYTQRAYPSGDIPATARAQAWEEKQQSSRESNLDENWTPAGPTNLAGRILCLAWHPTNGSIIYAGSASGGLWKTTDGGSNWFALTDALPSLAVGAIALEPGTPETIYIGTGEGSFNADAVYGAGVFKSTDDGATWNVTGLSWNQSQGRAINKIVINPSNPQILYAASSRISGGIFKSTNGGTTWTQYHTGDVKDLIIHPDSVNVLYCVNGDPWGNSANGVYRSTDSGVTWTRLSSGLPSATSMGRAQLTMAGSNHQTLYVGISQTLSAGAGLLGVYKTTNAGAAWSLQSNSPNMYAGQGWYNLVIAAQPTDPAIVYSSGLDCYKSTNSGASWTRKSFWSYPPGNSQYAHADHHDLAFQPGNPNTIIAATDGGLFKSTNGGDTWTDLNYGLVTYQFYAMGNDVLNSSVAYGGTQDNGTNKYTGSSSWDAVMGGDGGYCNVDPTNSNVVYAETQRGSHYKSTNGGTSWNMIQGGISGYGEWVTPVVMDPTNASCLYTGTTQVYKTVNGGTSWSSISPALSSYYVTTIAIAPSNTSVIYAGCGGGGVVWRTTDGGTSWSDVTLGLPNRYVTRVAVHPTNPNLVYATFSGYTSGHVFKSTNGGSAWTNSSTGLPDIPCNALVIDPNTPATMYAGTDLGVYVSTDGGASWTDYSTGLPNVVVDDLALHPTTGTLRAASHGRGLWETATGSVPAIVVLTPNGGDVWPLGTTQTMTWGTGGIGGNARLELNRSYPGGTWEVIIASTPNNGSYAWTVSGTTSSTARIRITSVETPSATDVSNSNFTIRGPIITLLRPVGGETMITGSVDSVVWSVSGTPGTYIVQLNRTYPSFSWTTIATTSNLSAPFSVSGPATSTARIRVYLQSDPTCGDTSSANFSIVDPVITVAWPNGGESLTPGQSVILRWNSTNVPGTKLVEINRDYPGGIWEVLAVAVDADSLPWMADQYASTVARMRVTSNSFGSATDVSDGNFTVLTPTLEVVTPNGGETWDIGSVHTVRWTRANFSGLVNVYYNNWYPSGTWEAVQINVAVDSVQWVVPAPVTGTGRIRVASVNLPSYMDDSNGDFSCGSGLTVTSPNGGENWSVTGLGTIAWTRANANDSATVQLNRSYPIGAWETLSTSAGGDNYLWTISEPLTSGARVRVYLTGNPSVGDTSDASFSIISSSLSLITPNGGEVWNTRMYQTVSWTRSNAPGPAAVLLNRQYPGGVWDTLATSVTADTFLWWVPNDGCSTAVARVRIVWQDVPQISDTSAADFAIVPNLVVTYPNGGEIWPYESTQIIRWRRSNSPGPVKVLMTRTYPNDGWFYLTGDAMGDSFVYTMPSYGATTTARVAVYMQDMSIGDTSDANFSIVPAVSADNLHDAVPREFSLDAPYPNPFNSRTNIQFALPKSGNVRLLVYDILGCEVARLVDEPRAAGYYTVNWDATNVASGIYLVRMTCADFVATRKLILLK